MTNEEIIAKIRLFADEQRNLLTDFESNSNFRKGEITAYSAIIAFLSDLEKSLPAKVADNEGLEKEMDAFLGDWRSDTLPEIQDDMLNFARHFYDLGCRRTAEMYDELEYNRQRAEESPLPEDTVLFNKGVEEGKRLMMEEAVEIGTTEICWVPDGDRVFPTFDPPVEDLLMPGIISQRFNGGDKVRVIIIKKED